MLKETDSEGSLVRVRKKASNPVNGTAPIAGGYRNDASIANNVSSKEDFVKTSSSDSKRQSSNKGKKKFRV